MNHKVRALFILKLRQDYGNIMEHQQVPSGMLNSAKFIADMLISSGHDAEVITVIDNNFIDREVRARKPTHVFIEGYWVVPEKFPILKRLHPHVKWIVRCHSEMPFLAQEGIALDWTFNYWKDGIAVAGNSPRICSELKVMARESGVGSEEKIGHLVPLLPNYYPCCEHFSHDPNESDNYINIGCFGAIRPLKNQLIQAIAAIEFANHHKKKLRFHVNQGRIELYGQNPVKNLRALFFHAKDHTLAEHDWMGHEEFMRIITKMDMCMQVSFSETFNIVTADAVNVGCPVVASKEITWLHPIWADPTSSQDIFEKMNIIYTDRENYCISNKTHLRNFSIGSKHRWLEYLNRAVG